MDVVLHTTQDPQFSTAGLGVFFLIGLLGGAHCLGMCGPLVTMYSNRMADGGKRSDVTTLHDVRQHALFNAGRTISYTAIGAAAAILGALLFRTADVLPIGNQIRAVAGIAVGIFILASGVYYITRGTAVDVPGTQRLFRHIHAALTSHVDRLVDGFGITGLGLIHGFLPCPLLYPAFLYAFVSANPLEGAASLAVLGIGTFPTLFIYGLTVQSLSARHRRNLHRVLGVAFILLAIIPLTHGLELIGVNTPHIEIPIYQPLN